MYCSIAWEPPFYRKSGCSQNFEFPTWKYDFQLQWNNISYWETRNETSFRAQWNTAYSTFILVFICHFSCDRTVFPLASLTDCVITVMSVLCDFQFSSWWCVTTFSVTNTARGNSMVTVLRGLSTGSTEGRSYLKKFNSTMQTSSAYRLLNNYIFTVCFVECGTFRDTEYCLSVYVSFCVLHMFMHIHASDIDIK